MRVVVEVRTARPEELHELAALGVRARDESATGAQLCAAEVGKVAEQLGVLLSLPTGRALVAVADGRAVGFVLARLVGPSDFLAKTVLYLEALYVDADLRRRGVGHALLEAVADLAAAEAATDVYAVPIPGARGVQRFLARLGFAPAASHRYVATATLQRRLAAEHHPSRHGQARPGLEEIIARRRRSRAGLAPLRAPGVVADPRADDVALGLGGAPGPVRRRLVG